MNVMLSRLPRPRSISSPWSEGTNEARADEILFPGFMDPVQDSLKTFRVIMNAMAHPGRKHELTALPAVPAPLYSTTGAVCLTLLDMDTPLWLDSRLSTSEVVGYLRFHRGCPITRDAGAAAFAVIGNGRSLPPLGEFMSGDSLYPHKSTTLIIQVDSLRNTGIGGTGIKGPGIATEIRVHADGLSEAFWPSLRANNEQFPQGVDVLLASPTSVCGLPRSVEVLA